jgi:hypothetical protein
MSDPFERKKERKKERKNIYLSSLGIYRHMA